MGDLQEGSDPKRASPARAHTWHIFFLEQVLQTNVVCTFSGVFNPSAASWAEHKQQTPHSKASTALWGSKHESHPAPALLMLGMALSWTKTKLPALNAEPARASSASASHKPFQGTGVANCHPLLLGWHKDIIQKNWAWLKWKHSSEASTSWNGSFLMPQYQNHKCCPWAHKSRSLRIVEHPHTAADRATLEQGELNNKTWLYSKSWWDLLVPPAFWNAATWLTWNKLKKLVFTLKRESVCITLTRGIKNPTQNIFSMTKLGTFVLWFQFGAGF